LHIARRLSFKAAPSCRGRARRRAASRVLSLSLVRGASCQAVKPAMYAPPSRLFYCPICQISTARNGRSGE